MPNLTLVDFIWITAVCGPLGLVVLWSLDRIWRLTSFEPPESRTARSKSHFLFQDDRLIDSDCCISALPGRPDGGFESWADLRDWLGDRFGPLPDTLHDAGGQGADMLEAEAAGDAATLTISAQKHARRVVLHDPDLASAAERHHAKRMEQILSRQIPILENVPCAIAILDAQGGYSWRNRLFAGFSDIHADRLIDAVRSGKTGDRICLPTDGTAPDIHVEFSYLQMDGIRVLYVTDISKVAEAEKVRREFIQTLTKTFANLTTGLAVFDSQRRLALFNPALLDLTGLPAVFLSGQPPLALFFDRLRDCKMLPEPRNYGDWREQINEMINSASDGRYQEDWHLVNGLTYRVTGRPHPDGAIAFLFEDISDEVAMTRQIRTQLDVRQATLDTLDKAIAVIGSDRSIVLCNLPCTDLLGIDPDGSFADMSLGDFLSACETRLLQGSFWDEVERAVLDRRELNHFFHAPDGALYHCQVARIPGKKMKISIMPQQVHLPRLVAKAPLPA